MKTRQILPNRLGLVGMGLIACFAFAETTENKDVIQEEAPQEEAKVTKELNRVERKIVAGCLVNEAALSDIKRKRAELETKEKEIAAKESELKAREVALGEELKKIEEIRKDVGGIEASKAAKNEERIAKLVETFESMGPKPASQILVNVEENLAVDAMSRLSTTKLAKIMNIMPLEASTRLTEALAMRKRNLPRIPASNGADQSQSLKGGEKDDGRNKNDQSKPDSSNSVKKS